MAMSLRGGKMKQTTNDDLMAVRRVHVPRGPFNVTPIFARRAERALIEDVEGRQFIDFAGGIGVENVGHCARAVVEAIKGQAELYIHTCFHIVMYESYVELARRLNEVTPGSFPKMTFFVNSGAEAVENAVKISRYATKRQAIIAFESGFHGRTYMAMSLTSKVKPYKWGFGPFCPEVYRMPFAYCYRCSFGLEYPSCDLYCAGHLEDFFVGNVAAESVAAVIAEPIQGEGGFVVPPRDYFRKIKAICEKHGLLLIMDEIQSGMGRTGRLYACEHFGVAPAIILTGKSLAGGLPLAAVTGRADVVDVPDVGSLGGTFGGNPVSCRAALAVLDMLQDGLLGQAEKLGKRVRSYLDDMQRTHEIIGDVRGLGPMMAIELVKDRQTKEPAEEKAKELVRRCAERGLIILSCGNYSNVIRTLMPLVITDEQLEQGMSILDECLREAGKN